MDRSGNRNLCFRLDFISAMDKDEQGFSLFFCQTFGISDGIIFQSGAGFRHCETLKNHHMCKNFGKTLRKALFNLP